MLVQLIQEVCQHPVNSPQRRKAMNKLLLHLQNLPNLRKSSHPDALDALNKTWIWVNSSICEKFDLDADSVETRLVTWINTYLKYRNKDLRLNPHPTEIPLLDEITPSTSPNDINKIIADIERQQIQDISDKIEQYINDDPEQILINCHPKNNPQANCKILSQRLLLQDPPDKMSHIATELNINNQTLNSHFKRNCLKHLQTIAKQLGYNHE